MSRLKVIDNGNGIGRWLNTGNPLLQYVFSKNLAIWPAIFLTLLLWPIAYRYSRPIHVVYMGLENDSCRYTALWLSGYSD